MSVSLILTGPFLVAQVPAETTPRPLFGRADQTALHWIPMDVAQLLDPFLFSPDVEVVKPSLPEMMRSSLVHIETGGAPGLADVARPGNPGTFQAATEPELESLHRDRQSRPLWLGDQQVYMLGHHDISQDHKPVTTSHPLQHLENQVAAGRIAQQRLAVITTEGEKVEIPRPVGAVEIFGHRWRVEQPANVCQ